MLTAECHKDSLLVCLQCICSKSTIKGSLMLADTSCSGMLIETARRFPFLLVDRVVEYESQKHAVGYKNVTANDNFFTGHFPDRKIMPGKQINCTMQYWSWTMQHW